MLSLLLVHLAFAGTSITASTAPGFGGTLGTRYTPVATFQTTSDDLLSFQIACKTGGCVVQKIVSRGSFDEVATVNKVTRSKDGTFTFSLTPKDALPSDVVWKPSATLLKSIEWTWVVVDQ